MDISQFKFLIWEYTRKINENTNSSFNALGYKHNLTNMQIRILLKLYQDGSHTIGTLAESAGIAGANISPMCKKLEQRGMLSRTRSVKDERVVTLSLTDQGRNVIKEIDEYFDEKMSHIMKNESEDDLDEIINGLKKLNDLLEKINADNN